MLLALVASAQIAAGPVATCQAPSDPQQRIWTLERGEPDRWFVRFRGRMLDRPYVDLPLPHAAPVVDGPRVRLSYRSANGGRSVDWRVDAAAATLDLYVNHGLEVNVEPDLDAAVDVMNTDGLITCAPSAVSSAAAGIESGREPTPTAAELQSGPESAPVATGLQSGREPAPVAAGLQSGRLGHEWQVSAGAAHSVSLFESTGGRRYAVQTVGWSRELTRDLGPAWFRGRFAWGVEVMPVFAQFSPSAIHGAGVAPLVWRWNVEPRPQWSAYAELAMGGLWTNRAIPEDTSRVNFTAHWGGGVRLRPRGGHALLVGYRFQHFSNGNQFGSNPGVNSHVLLIGWSYRPAAP